MRKVFIGVGICVIGAFLFFATSSQKQLIPLIIGGQSLNVEIANTSQKREQGLCCRESLPSDQGMLFVYDSPGDYRFWMKDTQIPLDMFWIDVSKHVVHIEENVQPDSYPQTFGTSTPAQYVLETNAGFAKEYGIKNRDKVAF
ncbi:DUF192 domain-containing protein [Candidatus Saccharibacteria bacterium]|nr:DUF192 domain-containing protein [Candidatus Saccharibacteria bacterium]